MKAVRDFSLPDHRIVEGPNGPFLLTRDPSLLTPALEAEAWAAYYLSDGYDSIPAMVRRSLGQEPLRPGEAQPPLCHDDALLLQKFLAQEPDHV
jgi:hypothetical protein